MPSLTQQQDVSTQTNVVDSLKGWFGAAEDTLGNLVGIAKAAVGGGALYGEEARLKGKYGAQQADSFFGNEASGASNVLSRASASASSAVIVASKSAAAVWSKGESSLSSA